MDAFAVERNFYKYEEQIKDVFYFYEFVSLLSFIRKILRYAPFWEWWSYLAVDYVQPISRKLNRQWTNLSLYIYTSPIHEVKGHQVTASTFSLPMFLNDKNAKYKDFLFKDVY